MTFEFLSIFHDFPRTFIFPGFSMIFHDRGNPDLSKGDWHSKIWQKIHWFMVFHILILGDL